MNTVVLLGMVFEGGYAFGLVLISCELGQRMTNAFEIFEVVMCKLDWLLFPVEVQQLLPPLLIIAQQPVRLECFGSNACMRESFKKVDLAMFKIQIDVTLYSVHLTIMFLFSDRELWILVLYGASSVLFVNSTSHS